MYASSSPRCRLVVLVSLATDAFVPVDFLFRRATTTTTKKKTSSSSGVKKDPSQAQTAWRTFQAKRLAHYKDKKPDWDGAKRRAKVSEEWIDAPENPKNNK
ncbi:hypothetical protein MNV49_000867 [Pseudohyphozyma bogoriensis]|nr:hypothetical protein MNV49_000867 [Pseudohyphozyma bogoriensis]